MECFAIIVKEYIWSFWTGIYRYEHIAHQCMSVNILYTKFFQAIAAKYKYKYIHIDQIPYKECEIDYPNIKDCVIIGSGMVSIVFEGIQNDKPVIIKTKRKGIEESICEGLKSIYSFTSWIDWFTRSTYDLTSVANELAELVLSQLDFEQEAINHNRYKSMFAYNPNIAIPEIFESTPTKIVMAKLSGVPLSSLTIEERTFYAKQLSSVIIKSLVLDGFIHADLHIGNVIFMENQLGIIDFGLMIELTKSERDSFFEIFKDILQQNYITASEKTFESFVIPVDIRDSLPPVQKEKIINYIVHIFENAHVNNSFSVYDIIKIIRMLYPYKVRVSPLFYKFGISLAAIDMLLKELSDSSFILLFQDMLKLISE